MNPIKATIWWLFLSVITIIALKLLEEYMSIASKINQRQRQILVHSVIYYVYNDNIVDDHKWSEWANELVELQKKFPQIALKQPYGKVFKDFDGSTGAFLPLDDPWAVNKALYLMNLHRREE